VELLDIGAEAAVDSTEDTADMVLEVTDLDMVWDTDSEDVVTEVTDSEDVVTEVTVSEDADSEDMVWAMDSEDVDLDMDSEDVDWDMDSEDAVLELETILTMLALFPFSINATLLGDVEVSCTLDMETAISLISTDLISPGITTTLPTPFLLNDVR